MIKKQIIIWVNMKKLCFIVLFLIIYASIPVFAQQSDEQWYKTELQFGANKHKGSVSNAKWKHFTDEFITPCFEDGYTVYSAVEYNKDQVDLKTVGEKVFIVLIVYKNKTVKDYCINSIMRDYLDWFPQQSVMRIDSEAKVELK